jgi:nicotinamidase-related amidase
MQTGLLTGSATVHGAAGLLQRIGTVLAWARRIGLPIVFIQDKDVGTPGSPEWAICPDLAPQAHEHVIAKSYADSFYQTDLHTWLQSIAIRRLIVVGCKTDVCIDMSCRRAVSLGYEVTLLSDGHSTTDNRFLSAVQSIDYYNHVLDGFGAEDGFGSGEHEIHLCTVGALTQQGVTPP